jgi:hypothetical protein
VCDEEQGPEQPLALDGEGLLEREGALAVSYRSATLASEMEAAVWTAIGLLAATSLGTFFYLGSRMDALASRLDARMDAGFARVDARMDTGFARVDARFDAIESRLDGLGSRLDSHLDQHAG